MIAVLVYVVAALILSVPAFFLGTGVQAIGALFGWWAGDPNANDGEEVLGTVIGLGSAIIVLGVAGAVVVEAGRRYRARPRPPILLGTVAIVVELIVVCVWVVAA